MNFLLLAINCVSCVNFVNAQNLSSPLALPSVVELRKKLDQECSIQKQNQNGKEILLSIEKTFGVRTWMDRRLDPSQLLNIAVTDESLEAVLDKVATSLNAEVGWIESTVYLAPKGEIARIEAAYWRLFQTWPIADRNMNGNLKWDDLAIPSEILTEFAKGTKFQMTGLDSIPHDLWSSGKLEKCSAPCKLTLLLSGFDRTAKIQENQLVIQPIENEVQVSARLKIERLDPTLKKGWEQNWPKSQLKSLGKDEWQLTAPARAHRELFRPARKGAASGTNKPSTSKPSTSKPGTKSNKVMSGNIKGIFGDILVQLCQQNQLELDPMPLPPEWKDRAIDLKVVNQTMEQVFQKIGQAASLNVELVGGRVTVREP